MSTGDSRYLTTPIESADARSGFSCGRHALDDYFARHAVPNDSAGIGRAYVLRRDPSDSAELPAVLGFYPLSMALVAAAPVLTAHRKKPPSYPMPVALLGRFAIDRRAQGRRLGERLLLDALRRVVDAAAIVGCTGIVVDAKDEDAARFYGKYDFVAVTDTSWPRRLFLPISTARAAFAG